MPHRVPSYDELPRARHIDRTPAVRVVLRTITPIYGGGVETRRVDAVDVIRVPTVRGHLRWWWRALFAGKYGDTRALFEAERERWGGIGEREKGRRSAIEVHVVVHEAGTLDPSSSSASDVGYALWPARGANGQSEAQRYAPGIEFELTVHVKDDAIGNEVRDCVRAWILFGGYGGRTRRGLGSFTVVQDAELWLPKAATNEAISASFGRRPSIFAIASDAGLGEVPRLAGAELVVGKPTEAYRAWTTALAWLRDFRQGTASEARRRGHPRGYEPRRPGISNWPEPDKVRLLAPPKPQPWSHPPRHNAIASWPRAGFGLPIGGRFQTKRRKDDPQREPYTEPEDFWLKWESASGQLRERLASPLIVKALPLADGSFAPIALWLRRDDPPGGRVVLCMGNAKRPGSEVPFGAPLVVAGDRCDFPAIAGKPSLQRAFLDWVKTQIHVQPQRPGARRNGQRSRNRSRGGHRP